MGRPRLYTKDEYYQRKLASNQRWKKRNSSQVNLIIRSRKARIKGAEGSFTPSDIKLLVKEQGNKCPGCLIEFSNETPYTVDHFIPIAKGGTNDPTNLQLLCRPCNCSKRDTLWEDWI